MTRAEHLSWCKDRALEYVDNGDWEQGMASMFSDLTKHEETESHPAISLGSQLMCAGLIQNSQEARKFIEGFN